MSDAPLDVLVLGAGIAGLAALRDLSAAGLRVAAVDKGRAAGGRMATRRAGGARFDHGAQFFTARDPAFVEQLHAWEAAGLARRWADGFPHVAGGGAAEAGGAPAGEPASPREPCWIGVEGMSRLARSLGEGHDVRVGTRVTSLAASGDGWTAEFEDGPAICARALLATPPVPQTLALLRAGGTRLDADARAALARISYLPCLAVMVRTDAPSRIPAPGGLHGNGDPITWIADNRAKGVSRSDAAGAEITIHASADFSSEHFDEPESVIVARLLDEADAWIRGTVVGTHLHRWRYSLAETLHDTPTLVVRTPAPAAFAGDGFGGPRVEGAYLSGLAAAAGLRATLG